MNYIFIYLKQSIFYVWDNLGRYWLDFLEGFFYMVLYGILQFLITHTNNFCSQKFNNFFDCIRLPLVTEIRLKIIGNITSAKCPLILFDIRCQPNP